MDYYTPLGDTIELQEMCELIEGSTVLSQFGNNSIMDTGLSIVSDGLAFANGLINPDRARADTLMGLIDLYGTTIPDDAFVTYVKNNMMAYAIIVGFGVLAIAICPFFFIFRCCCAHKCCKPKKAKYGAVSDLVVSVLYLAFSFVLAISGVMIYSNVDTMFTTASEFACQTEQMRGDSLHFFEELKIPVDDLVFQSGTLIDSVEVVLGQTDNLVSDLDNVRTSLVNFGKYLDNDIPAPEGYKFDVSGQSTIVAGVVDEIDTKATPSISGFMDLKDEITDQITNAKDLLREKSTTAYDMLDDLSKEVKSSMDSPIISIKSMLISAKPLMRKYPKIPVGLVFFSAFVGMLAVLAWLSPCKTDDKIMKPVVQVSWGLTYIIMIFMFILSGLFFATGLVMTDSCEILADVPKNFSYWMEVIGNKPLDPDMEQAVAIMNGCFEVPSIPVMETMGLADSFDFDKIFDSSVLGDVDGIKDMFDFGELVKFETDVNALAPADFGLTAQVEADLQKFQNEDPQEIVDALKAFNDNTPSSETYACTDCYATQTCAPDDDLTWDPQTPQSVKDDWAASRTNVVDACVALRDGRITALQEYNDAKSAIEATLTSIKAEFQKIMLAVAQLEASTLGLDAKLVEAKGNLDPLIATVGNIKNFGECGFVKKHFDLMSEKLCDATLGSVTNLATFMALIGFCSIFVVILANVMNVMMFGLGSSGIVPEQTFEKNSY